MAKEKKIIIIAQPDSLPYLALGLSGNGLDIKMIPFCKLNEAVIELVELAVEEFK